MATRGSPNTDVIRILTKRSWGSRSPVKKSTRARQRGRKKTIIGQADMIGGQKRDSIRIQKRIGV